MVQDQNGYLWIGTLGGLSRFDGRVFSDIGPGKGFTFDQVESLSVLSDGRLITGSTGAFSLYSDKSNQIISLGNGFSKIAIRDFAEANNKSIWLATQAGIFRYEKDGTISRFMTDLLGDSDVRSISFSRDSSNVLRVLLEDVLLEIRGTLVDTLIYREQADFYDMLELESDLFLASNGQGLLAISNGEIRQFGPEHGLISNRLLTLARDRKGNLFCGSRLGFSRLDPQGAISSFDLNNGLPYAEIRSLLIDGEDQLWLGTDGGGIIRFLGE